MITIHKFPLKVIGEQTILLPQKRSILDFQFQHGVLCMWAVVNTDFPANVPLQINIYGTGHEIKPEEYSNSQFHKTVQNGPLVWHIFVKGE